VCFPVFIEEFGLGVNMTEGLINLSSLNTHFAVLNSEFYWNSSGGTFGAASRYTFIDGNIASNNGGFGGGHNYYLAGQLRTHTSDYVFQRNKSLNAAPRNGKDGGGCSRGVQVAHGYIKNLSMINNHFEEEKGTSEHGCWGLTVDEGRSPRWGIEEFPGLVITGNVLKYTGDITLGITNADGALVGWNELYPEPKFRSLGFKAPNKISEDPESAIVKGDYVHNKIYLEGNTTGMVINIPDANLEYNEVIKLSPNAKCYMVNGVELTGDALGTNACIDEYNEVIQ